MGSQIIVRSIAEQVDDIERLIFNNHITEHGTGVGIGVGSPFMAGVDAFLAHKNTRIAGGVAGVAVVALGGPPAWAAAGSFAGSLTVGGVTISTAGVAQATVVVGSTWAIARSTDQIHQIAVEGDRSIMEGSLDSITQYLSNDPEAATNNLLTSIDLAVFIVETGTGFSYMVRGARVPNSIMSTKDARVLYGHQEYSVSDSALFEKVKTGLLGFYLRNGGRPIQYVDDAVLEGRNGSMHPVTGVIQIAKSVRDKCPTILEGTILEELHHFHQVKSRGWFGRLLTPEEHVLLEDEVVARLLRSGLEPYPKRMQ